MRRARPLLGTFVEIAVEDDTAAAQAAVDRAFAAVAAVHRRMSFHAPESDVSRLNRLAATRAVGVHPWTFRVLDAALDLQRRSQGIFDIAVGAILQDLGHLPRFDHERAAPPASDRSPDDIALLEGNRVRFRHPAVRIDLGGIAKGFAVDRAIEVLRGAGVRQGLVNAGGDLAAFGPAPCPVAIRDPLHPRAVLAHTQLQAQALASSGLAVDLPGAPRAAPSAAIDPRTGKPTRDVAGATVRAPSCMLADALTKVVMVAAESAASLLQDAGASALLVAGNGGIRITADWHTTVRLAA